MTSEVAIIRGKLAEIQDLIRLDEKGAYSLIYITDGEIIKGASSGNRIHANTLIKELEVITKLIKEGHT